MLPPIPSPEAHDCPNCGAVINEAKLKYCPECGAFLRKKNTDGKGNRMICVPGLTSNVLGAALLGTICLPMASCSIYFIHDAINTSGAAYIRDAIITVAAIPLLFAVLGVIWMLVLLSKR